jgi:hypothetical protein
VSKPRAPLSPRYPPPRATYAAGVPTLIRPVSTRRKAMHLVATAAAATFAVLLFTGLLQNQQPVDLHDYVPPEPYFHLQEPGFQPDPVPTYRIPTVIPLKLSTLRPALVLPSILRSSG